MKVCTAIRFGTILVAGSISLVALAAPPTSEVAVHVSTDGFYNEATIDQRFVTSPRARPTDLIN